LNSEWAAPAQAQFLCVDATLSAAGATATGTASPITVTGLSNGVSYTFTVVATNANGSSQPSAPSNAVTRVRPSRPCLAAT